MHKMKMNTLERLPQNIDSVISQPSFENKINVWHLCSLINPNKRHLLCVHWILQIKGHLVYTSVRVQGCRQWRLGMGGGGMTWLDSWRLCLPAEQPGFPNCSLVRGSMSQQTPRPEVQNWHSSDLHVPQLDCEQVQLCAMLEPIPD